MTANNEPTIHVEHDEAGTNVDHDTHDNAYSGLLVNDANWAFAPTSKTPWPASTRPCLTESTLPTSARTA